MMSIGSRARFRNDKEQGQGVQVTFLQFSKKLSEKVSILTSGGQNDPVHIYRDTIQFRKKKI